MKEMGIEKFKKLEEFAKYSFDPNDIYTRYYGFTIKTFDHKIYSIGNNICQDCGINSIKTDIDTFTQIDMTNITTKNEDAANKNNNNHVSCISNAANHMLYIINDVCYGNGQNAYGQLAPITTDWDGFDVRIPVKVDTSSIKDKIIQIQCGSGHCLFLTHCGDMFACGNNDQYQCGIDNARVITTITKIECEAKIKEIRCGFTHNLCLSDMDKLYVFGGSFIEDDSISSPTIHPFFKDKKIIFIDAKSSNSLCVDSDHIGYIFGPEYKHKVDNEEKSCPVIFQSDYPDFKDILIKHGCCGGEHVLIFTMNSQVISFSETGRKEEPHFLTKDEIGMSDSEEIVRVIAGDSTTLIVCY